MIAHLRKTRISPKKVSLVAEMVRRKPVSEALDILKFTPKKAAKVLYKVIQSAASNAENNFKQDIGTLTIKEIIVTQGPTYKRFQPVSRGRAHPILKRTSHVTVKVEATAGAKPKTAKKEDKPAETEKAEKTEEAKPKKAPKKEAAKKTTEPKKS